MYSTSKTAQVIKEMGNYTLDILGKCRWSGSGGMRQGIEWNTPLCIGFIDFKKAFDNINDSTL